MEAEMTKFHPHIPVMLRRSVNLLITDAEGIYVDATLGGAGHSAEILQRLGEKASLYGIDQDPEALDAAIDRVGNDPRFTAIQGNSGISLRFSLPKFMKKSVVSCSTWVYQHTRFANRNAASVFSTKARSI
jgi:16S rRNA C1402 N4-methylase RsmH